MEDARRAVEAACADRCFSFLGFREDIDAVIGACDMIVMPSDSEGVPQVLLAAMRDGVIPVCTRVGGVPGVLAGFDDCLADVSAEDIAHRALTILQSPVRTAELKAALQARFTERYTADIMARSLTEIYREALQ